MGMLRTMIFGIFFIPGSIILIWWNEGRAVSTAKALEEGAGIVTSVSSETVLPENEGKLIHISGKIITPESLNDPEFDIQANALRFRRNVEMYQWVEKKVGNSKSDDPANYAYAKEWSAELINSNEFYHPNDYQNPSQYPITPYDKQVGEATLGAFNVPESLIGKLKKYAPFELEIIDTTKFSGAGKIVEEGIQKIYFGAGSYTAPQLGDMKISFEIIPANKDYSIIARQTSNTVERFVASNGTSIEMIEPGIHSADNMFISAQQSNVVLTWGMRFFGFMIMLVGLSMILRPLTATASIIPLVGGLLNLGIFVASAIVSFAVSLIIVASAWLFYRPLLGISLAVIGVGIWYFLNKRFAEKGAME